MMLFTSIKILMVLIFTINDCKAQPSNESYDRSAQNCGIHTRQRCLEPLRKQLQSKHISFGKNEQEIVNTCKKTEKVISCLERMSDDCKTSNGRMRDNIEKALIGHKNLRQEFCDPKSALRLRYSVFAECIERNSENTIRCYRSYEKEMVEMMHEIPFKKQKFGFVQTDTFCCALDHHNICTRRILESQCNSSAADLAEQLFILSRGDISGECQKNIDSRQCNGSILFCPKHYFLLCTVFSIAFVNKFKH